MQNKAADTPASRTVREPFDGIYFYNEHPAIHWKGMK